MSAIRSASPGPGPIGINVRMPTGHASSGRSRPRGPMTSSTAPPCQRRTTKVASRPCSRLSPAEQSIAAAKPLRSPTRTGLIGAACRRAQSMEPSRARQRQPDPNAKTCGPARPRSKKAAPTQDREPGHESRQGQQRPARRAVRQRRQERGQPRAQPPEPGLRSGSGHHAPPPCVGTRQRTARLGSTWQSSVKPEAGSTLGRTNEGFS